MYTQEEFTVFGYVKQPVNNDLKVKMKYAFEQNMQHGRYCASAIAVIDEAANSMTCVKISDIKTNLDAFATA